MPRIELCDRCWDHGIERHSIGNVSVTIKVSQKAVKYHGVGHLCKNCYLAFEEHTTGIKGSLE